MKYLICQDWKNTTNSHAGMAHLCKLIKDKNDTNYTLINVPDIIIYFKNRKLINLQFKIQSYLYSIIYFFLALYLLIKVKKGDTIYLFEYLLKERDQILLAKALRKFKGDTITIYGLAHLVPIRLTNEFSDSKLVKYTTPINYFLTFGTSLTDYLIGRGIPSKKLITTFHYVDNKYFQPYKTNTVSDKLKVIVMGMQMRDFTFISSIVKSMPSVNFTICKAFLDIDQYFKDCDNIIIKGFMPEDELKDEMNSSDISLNLMIDTIGSNVITTSMAMGLAMLVSDVGSIRDYCNESNSLFCNTSHDFTSALNKLNDDRKMLADMKAASLELSKQFRFDNFYQFINNLQ